MTLQTWIIILTYVIAAPTGIFVICEPLNLKYKKTSIVLAYAVGSALLYIARAHCFIYTPFLPTDVAYFGVILPFGTYLFLRFICTDKTIKIVLFAILLYTLGILSNVFTFAVYYLIFGEYLAFDFVSNQSMYSALIAVSITAPMYLAFFFVWKKFIGRINTEIPNVGVFLLIIGGQLIYSMNKLLTLLSQPTQISLWEAMSMVIMMIGNLAILQIMLTNSKKKELEEHLNQIQHIRELEHMHYTTIENRRQEMVKIRHDFNNQLLAAHHLISSGKGQYAQQMLNELEAAILKTTDVNYCHNAIVNAVLSEKQKECDDANIILKTDIVIDDKCKISPLHLCSVFTNILDNAIRACKLLSREHRKIELRTAVMGGYLHIKCVNPVGDHPEKGQSGAGYGKIILSDIATHYGGNFTAEIIDKNHIALVSLLLSTT